MIRHSCLKFLFRFIDSWFCVFFRITITSTDHRLSNLNLFGTLLCWSLKKVNSLSRSGVRGRGVATILESLTATEWPKEPCAPPPFISAVIWFPLLTPVAHARHWRRAWPVTAVTTASSGTGSNAFSTWIPATVVWASGGYSGGDQTSRRKRPNVFRPTSILLFSHDVIVPPPRAVTDLKPSFR